MQTTCHAGVKSNENTVQTRLGIYLSYASIYLSQPGIIYCHIPGIFLIDFFIPLGKFLMLESAWMHHQQSGECMRMTNMQNLDSGLLLVCILQKAQHICLHILHIIWNLAGLQHRRPDLRYRYITISKVQPSILKVQPSILKVGK